MADATIQRAKLFKLIDFGIRFFALFMPNYQDDKNDDDRNFAIHSLQAHVWIVFLKYGSYFWNGPR